MDQYIQAIVALLAIANPLSAVPVFLQAVDGLDKAQRRKSASLAAVSVFAILLVAAVAGNWVLDIFGISISAFRCGGGLVILLMGLTMLQGRTSRVQKESLTHYERQSKIFVPIAMPLVAGPGAITTVITIALSEPYWQKPNCRFDGDRGLSIGAVGNAIVVARGPIAWPSWPEDITAIFWLDFGGDCVQFILAGAFDFFHQCDGRASTPIAIIDCEVYETTDGLAGRRRPYAGIF
ncbi:MAG: MarC family protein [Pirellulaceae bacterium]